MENHTLSNRANYAVILSSTVLVEDMVYRVMTDKLMALAQDQVGYVGGEGAHGETDILVTYWRSQTHAQAWMDNSTLRRTLSLAEQFWCERYTLRIVRVENERMFIQDASLNVHSRFPRIITERGVLRILEESQAPLLKAYINDERQFLAPWEPLRADEYYSLEVCQLRVREMRRDFMEDKGVTFCFLSPDEKRMLGYANYSNIIRGVFHACHLGYSLRESEQGKGLMQEILTAGNDYMFNKCNISRIQANYMPRNERSAAVLRRLHFQEEGLAKRYLKINGQWEDHVLTALTMR